MYDNSTSGYRLHFPHFPISSIISIRPRPWDGCGTTERIRCLCTFYKLRKHLLRSFQKRPHTIAAFFRLPTSQYTEAQYVFLLKVITVEELLDD